MANPRYTKAAGTRAMGCGEAAGQVDLSRFPGKWVNTNAKCIESCSLVKRDNAYFIRILGKNASEDWGEIEARRFAFSVDCLLQAGRRQLPIELLCAITFLARHGDLPS
jgi:hypothetical protein